MRKHWSTSPDELKKHPVAYAIWKLEERINHGVGEELIDARLLRENWNAITIDADKRKALSLALALDN